MPSSSFSFTAVRKPADGDLILLPWLDGKRPCFRPGHFERHGIPPEPGGSAILFAGDHEGGYGYARAVRLDAPHSTPVEELKKAVGISLARGAKEGCTRVLILLDRADESLVLAAQEGAILGGYAFDRYLSKKTKPLPVAVVPPPGFDRAACARARVVLDRVNEARDILNEPSCARPPAALAGMFRRMARGTGLRVSVWNEARLARERCGGILGVGRGAQDGPRLALGEYSPRGARGHLALVGKGVTFDTGGYSLKPAESQVGMKYDMAGAALVWGAACAIARLRLPLRLTVIAPLVRNDLSGSAVHVQDILRLRNGRTVEVANTDAEGRLILADALAIAGERRPDWILDAATLTGACVVALGEDVAGLFARDEGLGARLRAAGDAAGERFWPLPLYRPYAAQLKATVADGKNIGSRWGGAITAALFLEPFVPEKTPWLHLDIAGPGIKEEPLGCLGKGAKGFGIRAVVGLAGDLAATGAPRAGRKA